MDERTTHILLVEDQEAHAELLRRAFERHGERFYLTIAGNLEQARAYLIESPPDLVIVDWRLPDGRGTELLPAEGEERRFPLVVITSYGDEQLAVEAMKAGALDYVVKSEATLAAMPRIAERALREWGHITERMQAESQRDAMLEALRESEEQLQTLIDAMPDFVCFKDGEGRWLKVNDACIRIFQLESKDYLGKNDSELAELNSKLRSAFLT